MQKILLTGINGQVGRALQTALHHDHVIAVDRSQLDLSQAHQIRDVVQSIKPDLIINPAAYTAVDKAESEPELAKAINAQAPTILAEEAAKIGAKLIHFSTDYVYDGKKEGIYVETDTVNPVSVYGKTKLAGEEGIRAVGLPHLIFRTSWVYGSQGKNFLKTILRLAAERESLRIVADQFGAPTTDITIANAVAAVLSKWQANDANQSGVYHLVNAGETSWHGFATDIIASYQALASEKGWRHLAVKQVLSIATSDYPTPAQRPTNSRLSTQKLQHQFDITLPNWHDSLLEVMRALKLE